jgi:hypothetical protein
VILSVRSTTRMARRPKITPRDEFYAALGRFVFEWAGMEFSLDLLLLASRPEYEAARLPHELKEKLKCVKTQIANCTQRNAIEQLLEEIADYAQTRHDLVHGAVIAHFIDTSGITVSLGRMLQPARQPRRSPVKMTPAKILEISEHIQGLGDRLLDFAEKLLDMQAL